jgi:hypothetical protein
MDMSRIFGCIISPKINSITNHHGGCFEIHCFAIPQQEKENGPMNASKIIGAVSLLVGVLVLIVFASADIFRTGENPFQFGTWQIGGCLIGGALIVIGLVLFAKKYPRSISEERDSQN